VVKLCHLAIAWRALLRSVQVGYIGLEWKYFKNLFKIRFETKET